MITNHQQLSVCFTLNTGTHPHHIIAPTHQILKQWCELLIPINVCRSEFSAGRGEVNEWGISGQLSCATAPDPLLLYSGADTLSCYDHQGGSHLKSRGSSC